MEPTPPPQNNEPPAVPGAPGQIFAPGAGVTPTAENQIPPPTPTYGSPSDRPMAVASPAPAGSMGPQTVSMNMLPVKGRFSKLPRGKKFILPVIALLVLLGGSAGAYFGYVVPNKPENIWSKALSNTGKGYSKLSAYAENQFSGQAKGVKLDGTFKVSGTVAADGSFHGTSDGDNGEFTGSVSATGLKINLDTRVIKSTGNTPDIYFKVDGIQGLGSLFGASDPQVEKALNGLNGNWYFIDHTFFDQYAKGTNSDLQFTQADVKSLLDAVGGAAKQNIFTGDQSKMAFTVKQNIGKEKQDGRSVYHYKVGVNKANLKAFVNSLCTNLGNSSLKKFFNNDKKTLDDATGCAGAAKSVDTYDNKGTADVWVDLHTKLIHKVRFGDDQNKDNYFDIGQDYQGGDSFPFSIGFQDKSSGQTTNGSLDMMLNTKTNTLTFKGSAKESGDNGADGSLNLTIAPNSAPVKVDKPANPKSIIELLNDLGFGDIFNQVQSSAKDTERKTDLNAMAGHIEAFWADKGYYPTPAQINSPSFRTANFQGLDTEAFKDPEGTSTTLAAKPAAKVYSYSVSPAGCDNVKTQCTDYTLTATLDDGTPYAKQSLNSNDNIPTLLQ
jgi:hypothetical protein